MSGTGGGADGKEVTAVLAYFVCRAAMLLARQVPFLFTLAERVNPAVALRLGPELALVGHVWLQVPHSQWVAGGAEWVAERCARWHSKCTSADDHTKRKPASRAR